MLFTYDASLPCLSACSIYYWMSLKVGVVCLPSHCKFEINDGKPCVGGMRCGS